MKADSKNNSGKKGNGLSGKRSFLLYALLALVVVTAAAAVLIAPGGSENSSAAGTWVGTGLVDDPYQISSVQDLADLATDVNGGVGHTGDYFILTKDLDLNVAPYKDSGWTPIGNSTSDRFYGNFDGNGHIISNLYINNTTEIVTGLFGTATNCIIENLGVVNADVTGAGSVGGLIGSPTLCTIENCYVTGTVSGSTIIGGVAGSKSGGTVENCYSNCTINGNASVGGVVGSNSGTIVNCYNTGAVSQTGSVGNVGGVVGYNYTGMVENCYNTGAVTGSGSIVGGVVGANNSTVENCFFKWESGGFNGGLHGIGNDISTGNYSDTGAARTSDADLQTLITFTIGAYLTNGSWDFTGIGGAPPVWFMLNTVTYPMLFWQIADSGSGSDISDPFIVTTMQQMENIQNIFVVNGISNGKYWQLGKDIDATGYFAEGGPGYNGGAGWVPIGYSNTQPFQGSFDGDGHTITGLVINDTGLDNTGLFGYFYNGGQIINLGVINANITGGSCVGGVVGYLQGGSVENCFVSGNGFISGNSTVGGVVGNNVGGTVENCYNTISVTGSGDTVGGVVGSNTTGTVENCYNTGDVTLTGSGDTVGGVVGLNIDGMTENCYNTGAVTGSGIFVGGVVGYNDDTVSSCFFLKIGTLSGIGYGTGTAVSFVAGAPASTFTTALGWDFDNIWGIYLKGNNPSNPGYGYPYLKTIDNFILITPDGGGKVSDGNPAPAPAWTSDNPSDPSLFTGSLSYYPLPAINANTYNITRGTLDSPYYQISFNDGVQYEILSTDQIADSGSGTDKDPYIVSSMEQIENINVLTENEQSNEVYWQLGNDIDATGYFASGGLGYNGGAGWVPIGTDVKQFYGIFDGNGHTITGLLINTGSDFAGLFGYVNNSGEIMNLSLTDVDITGGNYVGGVAGCNAGTIENCQVTGTVGGDTVGGVVGINYGTVNKCCNESDVTGITFYVGGVVGNNAYGTVENCCNTGTIDGQGDIGGVAGANGSNSTVKNCYNAGQVTGSVNDVGGVVGLNNGGMTENCYNAGAVDGKSYYVGGVVGYSQIDGTVKNCYNIGAVTGGADSVGGVLGYNDYYSLLENCYNAGDVNITGSGSNVGCMAGFNDSNATVENCFFLESGTLYGIGNDHTNAGAVKIGDAEMRTQDTFPAYDSTSGKGWDFGSTGPWGLYLSGNGPGEPGYGYPYLKTIENYILIVPSSGKVFDGSPPPADAWSTQGFYNPDRPITVTLAYDPPNQADVGKYSVTVGPVKSLYYQISIVDDAIYVISAQQAPGTSYTITASSDSNSTITPSGQVSVQGGSSVTFTYSAASGYHISSVTVNGKDLSQDQITGSYTFTNVLFNNTIVVKSAPGAPITLTISIAQGNGYAEYSVNGSDFVRYVSPVPLNVSDSVTVRANAGDGYSFAKWETPATETNSEVTLTATSSLSLKAYFSESTGPADNGNSSNSNLWIWVLAAIIVLIIIAVIILFLLKFNK